MRETAASLPTLVTILECPGIAIALKKSPAKPDALTTVFAGGDVEGALASGVRHIDAVDQPGEQPCRVLRGAVEQLAGVGHAHGKTLRSIEVAAHAGTAFDGQHLFQLAEDRIQKIDPKTGQIAMGWQILMPPFDYDLVKIEADKP